MGLDAIILALWAVQALIVLAWLARTASRRRWFAAAGILLGLIAGFSPLAIGQAADSHRGTVVFGMSIILVLMSTMVLIVAYGIDRRWLALAFTAAIFGVPVPYILLADRWFSASSAPTILRPLEHLGELDFFLAPIACALAGREILAWVGRLVTHSKERMA